MEVFRKKCKGGVERLYNVPPGSGWGSGSNGPQYIITGKNKLKVYTHCSPSIGTV